MIASANRYGIKTYTSSRHWNRSEVHKARNMCVAVMDELHSLESAAMIKDLALIVGDYYEDGFRDLISLNDELFEDEYYETETKRTRK